MGLIISLAVLTFFTLIATMVFAVKLPTYFVQNHIGSATDASNVWSAVNIATVIGGFMFGPCYKKLGKIEVLKRKSKKVCKCKKCNRIIDERYVHF